MKQTAVDFLLEKLKPSNWTQEMFENHFKDEIEQAKEMEKENIKRDVYELCKLILSNPIETSGKTPTELFEQYYNETYGK